MIKEKDMIEIEFTAKTKDDNLVFDTTNEKIAKENNLDTKNNQFKPITVILGQNQLVKGLEDDMIGKEINKDYVVEIVPENGFGKKSAKLIKLIPTKVFYKQKINPVPGLQVNIDNSVGIVKTVTGGRTLVDFNHPLSSKDLIYEYKIIKIITDITEKAKKYVQNVLGIPCDVTFLDNKLTLKVNFPLNKEIKDKISESIKEVISEIKEVDFVENQEKKTNKTIKNDSKAEIKEQKLLKENKNN
ncbi:MAG: peptidylprolyl isomerase [Candidatus Woesearchaeota archaeon]